jgi:hypothetical protein
MTPYLFCATPAYGGGIQWGFSQSMMELKELCSEKRVNHEFRMLAGESLIDRARNNLAWDFLKSEGTHLMFIDADIDFRAADVLKMLYLSETHGYDIIGGAYPCKSLDISELAAQARANAKLTSDELVRRSTRAAVDLLPEVFQSRAVETSTGCVEVKNIATGFMMIRRRVFEQIAYANPRLLYLNDHPGEKYGEPVFDFFEVRLDDFGWNKITPHLGRKLSEDYGLCQLWRNQGGKVWCYLDADLGHTGSFRYQGEALARVRPPSLRETPPESERLDVVANPTDPIAQLHIQRYEWASRYIKNKKVANAACGTNYGADILERVGNAVTGFDISEEALSIARRDELLPVVLGDIEANPMEGFEALVSLETLEHLNDPFDWLRELASSVKQLVASVPIIPTMHVNPYHKHDFTVESFLEGLASTGWTVRETWVQCDDVLLVYAERA